MMRPSILIVAAALVSLCSSTRAKTQTPPPPPAHIVIAPNASASETLAAREVRRYVYLRTGQLLPILTEPASLDRIIVARKDRPIARHLQLRETLAGLQPQQYILKTIDSAILRPTPTARRTVYLIGGDDAATLYAAYEFARHLGVAFELDRDVIPDRQVALQLPRLDRAAAPLFQLRGIQPFHDFPEGPDWWSTDHYKAILSQLPKLRMNFFGLHTYPEGGVGPEPTVWIGLPQDLGPDGTLKFAYASSWQNTLRGNWGYQAKKTGNFSFGASALFDHDAYGSDVMIGYCPRPDTPEGFKEIFDRAGRQLREAFTHARELGIKTCVGTETPLIVPKLVRQRMGSLGVSGAQPLYEGIFQRIMRTYPLDYYWFWTPEDWTWSGVSDEMVQQTIHDLNAAIAAAKKVNAPFTLATCGWVLGPPSDRALFDKVLPKDMPVSCINRQVGKDPVEPGFANVQGRDKWAIPWLEDDPNLLMPQLWVGRMRKDAADSLKYGCTGLMGIHWRTRITSPNAVALAEAAWDQSPWNIPDPAPAPPQQKSDGAVGGQFAAFPNNPIAGTDNPTIYQTVRYNVDAYHLKLPDGDYTVTLQFCEPHYAQPGKRIFGVKLQGYTILENLDIFATVGRNRALDYRVSGVKVASGWLDIDFIRQTEFPSIAGIIVEGPVTRRINCGGPAHGQYAADFPPNSDGPRPDRYLPTQDFYRHWAAVQFGPEAAGDIAAIFIRIDGHLPQTSTWTDGPGGLVPNPQPWEQAAKAYAFVDQLAALRPRIVGAGNLDRFDYWLNNFLSMRAAEHAKCLWAHFNDAMKKVAAENDPAARAQLARQTALPLRIELIAAVADAYRHMLATVQTPGELGTVANWEQHVFPTLIDKPATELAAALGTDLPPDAQLPAEYTGPTRIIVPTLRTTLKPNEPLDLKVLILSQNPLSHATLFYRPLGQGAYRKLPLTNLNRGVYRVTIPPQNSSTEAIEYYLEASTSPKHKTLFPPTAPRIAQTIVISP